MDIGLFAFGDTVDNFTATVRQAHEQGFASVWVPQVFGLDALTAITVAGQAVPDIRMGTSVIPTYPRHPSMLAQQALTTASVIGSDRLVVGIGPSHKPVVEGMWGMSFDKPVRHVREYLEVLGSLLGEQSVRHRGEAFRVATDIQVPDVAAPKVMVAALGPQLLKVTGRLADGTILWMTGPTTIETHTVPTIAAAAEEAERHAPEIVAAFPVCVTDDVDTARTRAAKEFEVYGQLPSYRAMLDREGYEGPADLAIIGSAGEVRDRIEALATAGVTTFGASEFGSRDEKAATRDLLVGML